MRIDETRGILLKNQTNLTTATKIPSSSTAHKVYSSSTPPPAPLISHQDDARENRRFLNQAHQAVSPPKPSPSISHQDDARENRRFLNQAHQAVSPPKPSPSISHQDDARENRRFLNQAHQAVSPPKPSPSISHQDDARENRRFLNQAHQAVSPPKPSPSISHQDDARENRRFLNQAATQSKINYSERKDLNNSGLSNLQAPKPKDSKPAENNWLSDWGHGALDVIGVVDPFGVADGANALWYLTEGDTANAVISAAGMIPVIGDAAKVGKYGYKGYKAVKAGEEAVDAASSIKGGQRLESPIKRQGC